MRVGSRLLILKLAIATALLACVLLAMHFLLPGLTGQRGTGSGAGAPVVAQVGSVRVALPRDGRGMPTGPAVAQEAARQFSAFAKELHAELGPALGAQPPTGTIAIHVFASHAEALAFAKERKMKQDPAHPSGFYDPAAWTLAATLRPARELLALLFHLAAHLVMERAGGPEAEWSPWLLKGMGMCFEQGASPSGWMRLSTAARHDAAVILALEARNAHVPLHMLVVGGQELFRGPLGALAYREAGLLVAFLLWGNQGKHRDALARYIQLERQPGPVPPGSFKAIFGATPSELEKEWLAFLRTIAR